MLSSLRTVALAAALPAAGAAPVPAGGPPATSVPSPVALGVYQRWLPDDLAGLAVYEAGADRPLAIVAWYAAWGGWKSAFRRADLDAVGSRGSVPLITWEPWAHRGDDPAWSLRNAVLSGRHDAYVDSWARGLAAYGRPVLLRFAHEMRNGAAYPWAVGAHGNTPADYVAAWRHVRAIFARHDTANVEWVWNPDVMGASPAAAYGPVYRPLYPGDAYVDWIGLDVFNTGPDLDWGTPSWRSFGQILAEPYQAVTALWRKPLMLAEVGCTETGGSKAAWITHALTVELPARFPRVSALVWFDVDKEHEQPWLLHSSPSAVQAWIDATRRPPFTASSGGRRT